MTTKTTKTKLTSAQARSLREVIQVFDEGSRKWSCVAEYQPAVALLKLGYVKRDEKWSNEYRLVLEPTAEGRAAVKG